MSDEDMLNPYPGLRPFEPAENYLFFGRDGQSNELLRSLRHNRFLAVVGTSGCGKSSLIRAGLLPDLQSGMMADSSSRWRIALFRPGSDPIGNLASTLNQPGVLLTEKQEAGDSAMESAFMTVTLQRSALGIVDAYQRAKLPEKTNLLIVVDQFEELFRFKKAAPMANAADQAAAFVKLLLTAARHPDLPIYVIMTMRSDFLGDCTQFRDLPEIINGGQYLVPRMTRGERRQAITGPAAVGGAVLAPRLVQRLLNDVGDNPDQLPILQHALMRTWSHWQTRDPGRQTSIDLADYEAIGGMAKALSLHADEAFAELSEGQSEDSARQRKQVAEKLFKFLSEKGADNREIRHPGKLADIAVLAETSEAELISVIDAFRTPQRSFLMPPSGENLSADSLIDISHESLIRNWQKLKLWVNEETRSAAHYRRLADTAVLHQKGDEGVLIDPGLHLALDWRKQQKPNLTWALRYHPAFEVAMSFLDESRDEFARKQAAEDKQARKKELAQQRELEQAQQLAAAQIKAARLSRRVTIVSVSMFVIALLLATFGWMRNEEALALREYDFVREINDLFLPNTGLFPATRLLLAEEALSAVQVAESNSFRATVLRPFALWAVSTIEEKKTKQVIGQLPDTANSFREALRDVKQTKQLKSTIIGTAFSSDEQVVSVDRDGLLKRWSTKDLIEISSEQTDTQKQINQAVFSPDGQKIAVVDESNTARILNTETLKELHTIDMDGAVAAIAFSSDSQIVAIASKNKKSPLPLKLWGLDTRQETIVLKNQDTIINSIAFSLDNKHLATADKNGIFIWDVKSGKKIPNLAPKAGKINTVLYIAGENQSFLVCGTDNGFQFYKIVPSRGDSEPAYELEDKLDYDTNAPVKQLAFNPQSRKFAAASGTTIDIWTLERSLAKLVNKKVVTVNTLPEVVTVNTLSKVVTVNTLSKAGKLKTLSFSQDGRYLQAAGNTGYPPLGYLKVWDLTFPEELPNLVGHSDAIRAITFNDDDTELTTASNDSTVRRWSANSTEELKRYNNLMVGNPKNTLSYRLSRQGRFLAVTSRDGMTKVSDIESGTEPVTIKANPERINSLAFNVDGSQLAIADSNGIIKFWDPVSGEKLKELDTKQTKPFNLIAFHPDGKLFTTASDQTAKVWNIESREEVQSFSGHSGKITAIAFAPNGIHLATVGRDKTARIWDLKSGKVLQKLPHDKVIYDVSFSPNGEKLATVGKGGTVSLWDALSGKRIFNIQGHTGAVYAVAFSSDGRRIATAGADGVVRRYSADIDDLLELSRNKLDRFMNIAECKKFELELKSCKPLLKLNNRLQDAKKMLEPVNENNLKAARSTFLKIFEDAKEKERIKELGLDDYQIDNSEKPDKEWVKDQLIQIAKRQARQYEVQLFNITLTELDRLVPGINTQKLKNTAASALVRKGVKLAQTGDLGKAEATFLEALSFNPNKGFNPKKKALEERDKTLERKKKDKQRRAKSLERTGDRLARKGKLEQAEVSYLEALSLNPELDFDPMIKARQIRSKTLEREGDRLVKKDNLKQAEASYLKALSLNPELDFDPKKKIEQVRSKVFESKGDKQARKGELEQAEASYLEALSLNPELDFDPKKKARQVNILSQAKLLLREKDVEQALAKYKEAQSIYPEMKIPAISWATVCWEGVLKNLAAKVLDACEKAVELAPDEGSFRDSRGIARAMTGNLEGVVSDLEAYLKWAPANHRPLKRINRRKQWIEQLINRENPFSPENRITLLDELKSGG